MSDTRNLLDREPELDLLTGLLDDVDSSGGRVVLIRGEAGIGKTALVRVFIERVKEKAHVLFGRCDDLMTPRPLGPFWDMARDESLLADPLESNDWRGLVDVLLDLYERLLRPTIVLIEDTQWGDEATLDVIHYLGRRIGQANGLLVLTYREGEVDFDHPLRGVIGDMSPECVIRIRLGGLSREAVSLLIGDSNLDAESVFAATDGNPFLAIEMTSVDGGRVPLSVQDSVMARVGKLAPEAQETVKLLSVIPEKCRERLRRSSHRQSNDRRERSLARHLIHSSAPPHPLLHYASISEQNEQQRTKQPHITNLREGSMTCHF